MTINLTCPRRGEKMAADEASAGESMNCPACGWKNTVPTKPQNRASGWQPPTGLPIAPVTPQPRPSISQSLADTKTNIAMALKNARHAAIQLVPKRTSVRIAVTQSNQTRIPGQIRDRTRFQCRLLDHHHGRRCLFAVRFLHYNLYIPITTELSQDAEKALRLFCRLNRGEQPAEHELQDITPQAVLELHDAGCIDLPVRLAKLEFPEDGTARIVLQRTEDILLTAAGRDFCDAHRL